jgi:hypothetical protein
MKSSSAHTGSGRRPSSSGGSLSRISPRSALSASDSRAGSILTAPQAPGAVGAPQDWRDREGGSNQRARCMKAVLEVADGHPPGGQLIERPSSRGGMECPPTSGSTEPLCAASIQPRPERAIAPEAGRHFIHRRLADVVATGSATTPLVRASTNGQIGRMLSYRAYRMCPRVCACNGP